MSNKKKWTKPKLIVLARTNPEEMVLGGCKGDGRSFSVQGNKYCHNTKCTANRPS